MGAIDHIPDCKALNIPATICNTTAAAEPAAKIAAKIAAAATERTHTDLRNNIAAEFIEFLVPNSKGIHFASQLQHSSTAVAAARKTQTQHCFLAAGPSAAVSPADGCTTAGSTDTVCPSTSVNRIEKTIADCNSDDRCDNKHMADSNPDDKCDNMHMAAMPASRTQTGAAPAYRTQPGTTFMHI